MGSIPITRSTLSIKRKGQNIRYWRVNQNQTYKSEVPGVFLWPPKIRAGMNPNYDIVDSQISDMHNEAIDAMAEDADLMSSTARGMDATSMTRASGDGANASQAAARSSVQVDVAPGRGSQTAARGSGRR